MPWRKTATGYREWTCGLIVHWKNALISERAVINPGRRWLSLNHWNQGWGLPSWFPPFPYLHNVYCYQHTIYSHLGNITVIFGRNRRSLAVVISVKYECHFNNLACTFVRSNISWTWKLTNGVQLPPPLLKILCTAELRHLWSRECRLPSSCERQ